MSQHCKAATQGCNTILHAFVDDRPSFGSSEAMATPTYTSPYREFCREQRPLLKGRLPAGIFLKNADREKVMGQMWKDNMVKVPSSRATACCSGRPGRTA